MQGMDDNVRVTVVMDMIYDNVKVTVVMDRACRDEDVGRAVKRRGRGILKHMGPIPQPIDLKTLMYR